MFLLLLFARESCCNGFSRQTHFFVHIKICKIFICICIFNLDILQDEKKSETFLFVRCRLLINVNDVLPIISSWIEIYFFLLLLLLFLALILLKVFVAKCAESLFGISQKWYKKLPFYEILLMLDVSIACMSRANCVATIKS